MSSRPAWSTRASSRTASTVTQRNPVSKNQKKKKKKRKILGTLKARNWINDYWE